MNIIVAIYMLLVTLDCFLVYYCNKLFWQDLHVVAVQSIRVDLKKDMLVSLLPMIVDKSHVVVSLLSMFAG